MKIRKRIWAPVFLSAAGAALMAAGIINGELTEIMHKAIIICLECIGIG